MNKKIQGFTLLELLISITIIGILAAAAIPTYTNYMQESRRSDAVSVLLQARLLQEQYRATNTAYTTVLGAGGLEMSATSPQGHYSISITAIKTDANGFEVVATATGSQASDTACSTLVIDQNGPDVSSAAKKLCWGQ